ncbi:MAG: 6-carboxytetrahydropterin synthase [Saprospiraceae bacterium]|nr:6-carboxytetrahydropterin synthase [Saprospiraceae bacterium]MCF8310917.1 6-carboxytetrahydropterin synthase [Saprospiraceae bacterium]MCF8439495.1 6-carboxytetrahydropterin synthase [Saprospiraceae bacterium]
MAHALAGYDGDCRNIHGHSYKLFVTLRGTPLQQPGHPQDGMVMDFSYLKKLVKEQVLDTYDHALVLNATTASQVVETLAKHYQKLVPLPFQPTCENLLLGIVEKIQLNLPPQVELFEVKIFETATSSATWCAEDGRG